MSEHRGWLIDLYAEPEGELALWFLDENGKRRRLRQEFPVTFYASGNRETLREAWRFLMAQPIRTKLSRSEEYDIFQDGLVTTMSVQVQNPFEQPGLFRRLAQSFPQLTYYNADLQLGLRHAAVYRGFPLAHCRWEEDTAGNVLELETMESPWALEPSPIPLRILSIEPDERPRHAPPRSLKIQCGRAEYCLKLESTRALLVNLAAILRRHDPDILMTAWGDTWLLPHLLKQAETLGLGLPLNRDERRTPAHQQERTYFSYGQIIYQGEQVLLYGRSHIDIYNAMLFHDYGLEGVLELARVTSLPIQTVARCSPGSGISALQIITALRQNILVPWHKQEAEHLKSARDLLDADKGGLVYQPITGLHHDVAEVDFVSMYPSIMVHFNISPETVDRKGEYSRRVPELDLWIDQEKQGLIPQTLAPLLEKRISIKQELAGMQAWDPRRNLFKARASAHKWLLVTCFGYLGYKNARFGRIEAHEAVTAYGREALLRAKEVAEDLGYTVLHLYVDGMWVKKEGHNQVPDFQPLLEKILDRTGLPVALDGIYRWVAFAPSKIDDRIPVPNRYFGVFQDGSIKMRGIETRRRDTPPFLKRMQEEMIHLLGGMALAEEKPDLRPVLRLLQARLGELRRAKVPAADLLVTHKVSRNLEDFRVMSPAARAALQLLGEGKILKPGQHVRFLKTLGAPGVHAWDLAEDVEPGSLDREYYTTLLIRAAGTILQPFGVSEDLLQSWLLCNAAYGAPPGVVAEKMARRLPLFAGRLPPSRARRLVLRLDSEPGKVPKPAA